MNILGGYNDDYGLPDFILLIDAEENFAINKPTRFKLDPSSFVKDPSLFFIIIT